MIDRQIKGRHYCHYPTNTRRALKGNALREYKQTITLSQIQREVLVGTLLGDASIPLYRGKPRLNVKFAQKSASADYIQHLYSVFYNPVGRLCWYTSASTEYSWQWRAGSTMYVVSNLWSPLVYLI